MTQYKTQKEVIDKLGDGNEEQISCSSIEEKQAVMKIIGNYNESSFTDHCLFVWISDGGCYSWVDSQNEIITGEEFLALPSEEKSILKELKLTEIIDRELILKEGLLDLKRIKYLNSETKKNGDFYNDAIDVILNKAYPKKIIFMEKAIKNGVNFYFKGEEYGVDKDYPHSLFQLKNGEKCGVVMPLKWVLNNLKNKVEVK